MKVFVMWSGRTSGKVATHLYHFLGAVVQRPHYFVSTEDMPAGCVWDNVIAGELEMTHFGIACLASDNLQSSWIHFEAGAISKVNSLSVIVPYLIGIGPSQVTGPLTRYQAVVSDKKGTRWLIQRIDDALPEADRPNPSATDTVFEALWPDLERTITQAVTTSGQETAAQRPMDDMLREILTRMRHLESERAVIRQTFTRGDSFGEANRTKYMQDALALHALIADQADSSDTFCRVPKTMALGIMDGAIGDIVKGKTKYAAERIVTLGDNLGTIVLNSEPYHSFRKLL